MQWEELCEKAKTLGYNLFYYFEDDDNMTEVYWLENEDLSFYENGQVEFSNGGIISKDRTPDQMWQIMRALR